MPQVVSADDRAKSASSKYKDDDALRLSLLKSASDFRFAFGSELRRDACSAPDFSAADNRCTDENAAKTAAINMQR